MASKQLGKLRQWAGEVISSREKTTVTDEFRELEQDVELRKYGINRLYWASESYHHVMSKKKDSEALEDPEKLLPIDTLGIVMITHGEEFGDDSKFGTSLAALGRAHCNIATIQETYANELQENLMRPLENFREEFREYDALRKKLESRRLSLDAAISKSDKAKKDKDKKEAEEELQKAKARYEDMEKEVEEKMQSLQRNEVNQLRVLTSFLDLEINFVEQYLEVLQKTKSEWTISSITKQKSGSRLTKETSNKLKRSDSGRRPKGNSSRSHSQSGRDGSSTDDEDEPSSAARRSHRRSDSNATAKTSSRPTSRASVRKRSDSTSTANATATEKEEKEKSEKGEKARRISMAGWASTAVGSAVGSVASIGKMGKEKFSSFYEDSGRRLGEDEDDRSSSSPSFGSLGRKGSSKRSSPPMSNKPPGSPPQKVVRAVHSFTGSNDELSFKTGDEIVVVNEVLEEWWMGELNGKKGLFPTSYTEVVPATNGKSKGTFHNGGSEDEIDRQDTGGWRSSDFDEEEAWHAKPLAHNLSPLYDRRVDAASITSAEDDDDSSLLPSFSRFPTQSIHATMTPFAAAAASSATPPAIPNRSTSTPQLQGKKPPPPPPPRRSTTTSFNNHSHHAGTPPIPDRRPPAFRTNSQPAITSARAGSTMHTEEASGDPFDSVADTDEDAVGSTLGCDGFRQNPFKPKGMCSNCFQFHG